MGAGAKTSGTTPPDDMEIDDRDDVYDEMADNLDDPPCVYCSWMGVW